MFRTRLYPLLLVAVVAGCSSQPAKDPAAAKANLTASDLQCHSEPVTGSMMNKKVCTTKAQRDAQQRTNDAAQDIGTTQFGSCVSGGGAGCSQPH